MLRRIRASTRLRKWAIVIALLVIGGAATLAAETFFPSSWADWLESVRSRDAAPVPTRVVDRPSLSKGEVIGLVQGFLADASYTVALRTGFDSPRVNRSCLSRFSREGLTAKYVGSGTWTVTGGVGSRRGEWEVYASTGIVRSLNRIC